MAWPTYEDHLLHVRYDGRSFDVALSELDLGAGSGDAVVKRAVADYLNVPAGHLRHYVIDRHANGNLTLRPQAVFG